jgi:hypothetical protein
MRWRTLVVTTLIAIASSLAAARPAAACSCAEVGSPCRGLGLAQAVFVGRVTAVTDVAHSDVERAMPDPVAYRWPRRFTVEVTQQFSGTPVSKAEVFTGAGDADCGVNFVVGETYLIYASQTAQGDLVATICSRTRLLSAAAEDLSFFRSFAASPAINGRLTGTVTVSDTALGRNTPLSNMRVVAGDGRRTITAVTDANGRFEMTAPVGRYEVHVEPEWLGLYSLVSPPRVLDLRDPRACVDTVIVLRQ